VRLLLLYRCVLQIEPNAPKKGLVRRVLHKARHPRGKGGGVHDALVGELLRLPPPGKKGETLLDTCSGTWLTDLTWDKVRGVDGSRVSSGHWSAGGASDNIVTCAHHTRGDV
jgi:hypothetical protein